MDNSRIGEITYKYVPDDWNQGRYLALGGFTVVFLNYNKRQWLSRSVASALAQDYPLLEMFFMDDASTDGSGDIMEQMVREYSGRHKVTVVRNTVNQHIAGQWNIVSRLTTGQWLGMFCGDDVSNYDRVTKVAERLKQYPTAKGICTASRHWDYLSGKELGLVHHGTVPYILYGDEKDIKLIEKDIDGATSFYHKSLFDNPLPCAPLDDYLLRWIVMGKSRACHEPAWIAATDLITVDYTRGSGISSADIPELIQRNRSDQWLADVAMVRSFASVEVRSRAEILKYLADRWPNELQQEKIFNHYRLLNASIVSGNTFSRLYLLPRLGRVLLSKMAKEYRKRLIIIWLKRFILEFFGLTVASRFAVMIKWFRNN